MSDIAKVSVEKIPGQIFDYRIPKHLQDSAQLGSHVVVPFRRSNVRGMIVGLDNQSSCKHLKSIVSCMGGGALIQKKLLDLAHWMSDYYLSSFERSAATLLPSPVRRKPKAFKTRQVVSLREAGQAGSEASALLKRSPKQTAIVELLLQKGEASATDLLKEARAGYGALRGLERKGLIEIHQKRSLRDPMARHVILPSQPLPLMPQQSEALASIQRSIDTLVPSVSLLYGVTGSGKTEVYLQAIQYGLDQQKGSIVLVPEIALTPQMMERFRSRFGAYVAVLHSHLSDGERHDEWHRIRDGEVRIVVGARSALFAPVQRLGLIVVDEEHEPSYKQDEAPRYHARDMAVVRGKLERCAVVLGSATPSLESYHNASTSKYGLLRMPHRVDHRKLPSIRIVDMRLEAEREQKVFVLSKDLCNAIQERLSRAEQTLLFLNRRGFSTSLICPQCGHVEECQQCSVSMTYHKCDEQLRCHLCGALRHVPRRCPNPDCRDPSFRFAGVGTQRVEEVVCKLFPKARVHRMDSDTMKRKDDYDRVLGAFRTGKIDILIGTQMIAKGLHFPNVTLVGVVFADLTLHMPDFRAGERTFQLLTQVAGRAGRGDVKGEVLVQTYSPGHPSIQAARASNYERFYDQEIAFRKELGYPPFTHLVVVTARGRSEARVLFAMEAFVKRLSSNLPREVILSGPLPSPIARAKGLYRFQCMLRASGTTGLRRSLQATLKEFKWPAEVRVSIDMDAQSVS